MTKNRLFDWKSVTYLVKICYKMRKLKQVTEFRSVTCFYADSNSSASTDEKIIFPQ